eukprot:5390799-Pleurochrysis_carterae.AAC.1
MFDFKCYALKLNCRTLPNRRSKAARGPSRSSRPTLWNHARLSWRVLTNSDSLPWILPKPPSERVGATNSYIIRSVGGREQARALGLGRVCAVAQGGG